MTATPHSTPPRQDAPGATPGLILGIVSIVFPVPIIGLILAWLGFSNGRTAARMCRTSPTVYHNGGVATAAIVVTAIGLGINLLSTFTCCGYLAFVGILIGGEAAGN